MTKSEGKVIELTIRTSINDAIDSLRKVLPCLTHEGKIKELQLTTSGNGMKQDIKDLKIQLTELRKTMKENNDKIERKISNIWWKIAIPVSVAVFIRFFISVLFPNIR